MTQATDYLEDAVLNHAFRNIAYAYPGQNEMVLFTASPGESGSTVNEVPTAGGSYGRLPVTWNAPVGTSIDLAAVAGWVDMPATTVTHWAVCEPLGAGGTLLVYGAFGVGHTLLAGQSFDIAAGMATVSMSGDGTTPFYQDVLNLWFRGVAYAAPGVTDLRLFTADPGVSGALTNEVVGGGYGPQACAFDAPSGGIIENTAAEIFPNMPAGDVAYWGLSRPSDNELMIRGAYDTAIPVAGGENFRQLANTLEVQAL